MLMTAVQPQSRRNGALSHSVAGTPGSTGRHRRLSSEYFSAHGDETNVYSYVGADPVNNTDPSGMYECGGNKGECKQIAKFAGEIRQAAANARQQTGSRIASSHARALSTLSKFIGAEGDKNGVTISNASLKEGTLGDTGLNRDGSVGIRLDLASIGAASAKNVASGAGVLAHEATHGVHLSVSGQFGSLQSIMASERAAYGMESITNHYLGQRTSLSYSSMTAKERREAVERRAHRSCAAVADKVQPSMFPGESCLP